MSSENLNEKVKSVAQLRQRARSRKRRGNNRNVVVIKGKVHRVTGKMRAAFRKSARRLSRVVKSSRVQRIALRTKRIHARRMGESMQHSPAFLLAASLYAAQTGDNRGAALIIEATEPAMTSTPIGIYGLEVSEKLDQNAVISGLFADVTVMDEKTLVFFFEKSDSITEGTFERELSGFGTVDVIAKPGDAIAEDLTSDLYVVALTVSDSKLKDLKESFEADAKCEFNEAGDPIIDESKCLSEDQVADLVRETAELLA